MAQELYDGEGKKVITYPRAETRYLPESLDPGRAPDRRRAAGRRSLRRDPGAGPGRSSAAGSSGHFHDKGLARARRTTPSSPT